LFKGISLPDHFPGYTHPAHVKNGIVQAVSLRCVHTVGTFIHSHFPTERSKWWVIV